MDKKDFKIDISPTISAEQLLNAYSRPRFFTKTTTKQIENLKGGRIKFYPIVPPKEKAPGLVNRRQE